MSTILGHLCRVVDSLSAVLMEHPSAGSLRSATKLPEQRVSSCLVPLLWALGASTNTIAVKFSEPGLSTPDMFCIARRVLECAINICYVCAEGLPAAERAHRHAAQKGFRDLDRESQLAGTTIRVATTIALDAEQREQLRSMQGEFEWPNGREKSWTDLSVDQRIARVYELQGDRVGDRLHVARFALFRHASEMLHGTLYGQLFAMAQLPAPSARTAQEVRHNQAWMHMTAQASVVQAVIAVVESFDAAYGFKEALQQAKDLHALVHRLPGMTRRDSMDT
ncbi:MAG: hypothetical protein U1E73_05315 [Planctomycetota bacterium]